MDVPNNSGTALTIHIKYANCPIPTSNHSLRIIIAANQIKSSKKKKHSHLTKVSLGITLQAFIQGFIRKRRNQHDQFYHEMLTS